MGLFDLVDFKDIQVTQSASGNMGVYKAKVKMSRFIPRFQKAQVWLERQIMEDMKPYVAKKTGALLTHVETYNRVREGKGEIMAYALRYGEHIYHGLNSSGQPVKHWTNPNTKPYWFEFTKKEKQGEWTQGCKDIIIGRKKV